MAAARTTAWSGAPAASKRRWWRSAARGWGEPALVRERWHSSGAHSAQFECQLPALGVVLVSLGVLLEDFLIVAVGLIVGAGGIMLGKAAAGAIKKLF